MKDNKAGSSYLFLPHELTSETVRELEPVTDDMIGKENGEIVLDASDLTYMNSKGVSFILRMLKKVKELGGSFKIKNLKGVPFDIVKRTGLDKLIDLC